MTSSNSKVYIEILKQIRSIVEEDGLVAGDKIPSERELSDRLNVGRSSVREALRSLELLGIIETRRGEGTYIKNFGDHQLVQVLGTFILQDVKVKKDLIETKYMIERNCITLACERITFEQIKNLTKQIELETCTRHHFFRAIAEITNNQLFIRIWQVISEYFNVIQDVDKPINNRVDYHNIVSALAIKDVNKALNVYDQIAITEIVE
ncbi:GntR family transcriptional regulator [Cytobacillus sp. S13-E01]|uniref:FadR/GntR family transcriptional regulator n=1 Tax=Cytobacillus sp. S13-E01 TaxID=3031326 RepID=UPI0023D7C934|nr:GntR family transcriptional regulator [Cytobacillus sp. S13-E01]MDF0727513.1 GntR family transcriptional regulator [Cytobacillus sp. S13-E01]